MATISIAVRDLTGKETGATYSFDSEELASGLNKQLMHDAVVMYQANLRQGTHKSKSRSEVAGSSAKLFKQKGTGRARMGNKRTCIRRGGGHCFHKLPKDWSYRLPRKALQLATRMAVLSKFMDGQAVVIQPVAFEKPQTKAMATGLKSLGFQGASCLVAIEAHNPNVYLSTRNIPRVDISPAGDLNCYAVLRRKQFVVTTTAMDLIRGVKVGG